VTRRVLIFAAVVAVIWVLNALLAGDLIAGVMISPYVLQILTLAGINVILAVSLNLINGFTGQFSIGHAGFMAIGAYTSSFLSVNFGQILERFFRFLPEGPRRGAVLVLVLAVGAICAAIAGFLVGVPSLRLRGDYLAIVTLGFGEIIRVFILNIDAVGGARGFSGIPKYASFGWVYFFAVGTIVVVSRIVNSSFGRTLLAVREDEIAAEAMGVNTTRAKVISFVISSSIAGIAGGLFAHYLMYVHTNSFTFLKSIEIIIMIVLGGLGSITGSVVGAMLYIALTEGLRTFEQYRMVAFSLLLILIMIFRPQGLMGHRELFGRKRRDARQPAAPNIEA
jgi:branched-chain amino acid transport system permease protein